MKPKVPAPLDRLRPWHYPSYANGLAREFGTPLAHRFALYRLPMAVIWFVVSILLCRSLYTFSEGRGRGAVVRISWVGELAQPPSRRWARWWAAVAVGELAFLGVCAALSLYGRAWWAFLACVVLIYIICEALPGVLRKARHGNGTDYARWEAARSGHAPPYVRFSGLVGVGTANEGVVLVRRVKRWVVTEGLCVVTEAVNERIFAKYVRLGLNHARGSDFGVYGP